MPSKVPEGATRGWIVPIGGAENKENDRHILERFVAVSGGRDADIVVIPTASRLRETGPRYEQLFRELGAARVNSMDFDTRRDCQEPSRLARIAEATGIFFTGGKSGELGGRPARPPETAAATGGGGVPIASGGVSRAGALERYLGGGRVHRTPGAGPGGLRRTGTKRRAVRDL